jgi:hypothetical protein
MKDWYASFAIHRDPNKERFSNQHLYGKDVTWPAYSTIPAQNTKTVLNVNSATIKVGVDPDANARCNFWHSESAVTRN